MARRQGLRVRYVSNWRDRPSPYWFFRNWDTLVKCDLGPFTFFYYKRLTPANK